MNRPRRRLLSGIAASFVVLLGLSGSVRAASPSVGPAPSGPSGNEMLSVQPSLISVTAQPGTTAATTLTVRAAASLDVTIKSQGLAQSLDGNFISTSDAGDTSPYSARGWLSASRQSLHVEPGDKIELTVNIAVPQDAGEGTRYGILAITGLPVGADPSSNVGFGVELGVSAIVQIADTPQTKTGEIKGIDVGKALPGQPLPVTVSFLNTGNSHYGAQPNELVTTATLQDSSGALLSSSSANGNLLSVVPSFTRAVPLTMPLTTALVNGDTYHLEVGVGLKDGSIFDRKALDFTWSGGEVLTATGAPIEAPPTGGAIGDNSLIIIVAALIGAAVVAALFLILPRLRRRLGRTAAGGDGTPNP